MNERCSNTDCAKPAKFKELHPERGVIGFACQKHKGPRINGHAYYQLDATQCPALMDDGMPCDNPAKFMVKRKFSGIDAPCCGVHQPSRLVQAQGMVTVEMLGGRGA